MTSALESQCQKSTADREHIETLRATLTSPTPKLNISELSRVFGRTNKTNHTPDSINCRTLHSTLNFEGKEFVSDILSIYCRFAFLSTATLCKLQLQVDRVA